MHVQEIIDRKGGDVVTVSPDDEVQTVVAALAEHGFGALVVSADGRSIDGIVSERDIVRRLASGPVLETQVSEIMTSPVKTCSAPVDHNDQHRSAR